MVAHNNWSRGSEGLLPELAALWGVQTGYRDARGRWRESPPEAVLQVLEALGAGYGEELVGATASGGPGAAKAERGLERALALRRAEMAGRLVEPVLVAWEGMLPPLAGLGAMPGTARATAPGTARARGGRPVRLTVLLELGGECGVRERLPFGYHRLRVETGDAEAEAAVISAPRRCWSPPPVAAQGAAGRASRPWGAFAPLYALRSRRDWGAGDLGDLELLRDLVADAGGRAVATLPLLATYLDRPFEPCPYSPVSRMFWNEFYLAVDRIQEWAECPAARAVAGTGGAGIGGAGDALAPLREQPSVQYREVMAVKRRALEELCRHFFAHAGTRRWEAFAGYVQSRPELVEYAAFRARVESFGADWRSWAEGEAEPASAPRPLAVLSEGERFHLFCQWQMDEQLGRLSGSEEGAWLQHGSGVEQGRPGLLLDVPVGVHPGGFDTWKWRDLFAGTMSSGAPPDAFFARGQDWASPPLHPQRIREHGHGYYARCLREHMRHARFVRIDHVMSLHRLFWVPGGRQPTDGVYVSYPAEELYAVLCLESHLHRTVVVGEDLGTVPAGVRAAMRRRGVLGTWVLQSSLTARGASPVRKVPASAVAALGTHDMFPFAGFVRGDDIGTRLETGQLDQAGARRESETRRRLILRLADSLSGRDPGEPLLVPPPPGSPPAPESKAPASIAPEPTSPGRLLRDALTYLWDSPAALVLVNLEDLLLETRPQNLPGTDSCHGNWRRKLTIAVEGLDQTLSALP